VSCSVAGSFSFSAASTVTPTFSTSLDVYQLAFTTQPVNVILISDP
jgi:hypothetical protein